MVHNDHVQTRAASWIQEPSKTTRPSEKQRKKEDDLLDIDVLSCDMGRGVYRNEYYRKRIPFPIVVPFSFEEKKNRLKKATRLKRIRSGTFRRISSTSSEGLSV